MEAGTEREDRERRELARRFRAERKRVGLSATSVAHHCGVTESTVFNWEAGRARVPLSAIARLWRYGFDAEELVKSGIERASVSMWPVGASPTISVPAHLLRRHRLSEVAAFVYHNRAEAAEVAALGDLLVMGAMADEDMDILEEIDRTLLLEPREGGGDAFLCRVSRSRSRRVKLELGEESGFVNAGLLLQHCSPLGDLAFRLGHQGPFDQEPVAHTERLAAFLRRIG